nr:phosphatase PAP2 family protein [Dysgonomonas sp. GY617]
MLLFVFCDQFSSYICKPLFSRLRSTHHPDFMNDVRTLYGYVGGKYGFISGHATNSFGFATLTSLLFRNKIYRCVISLWAFICLILVYISESILYRMLLQELFRE